jgi:hypothetical protein
MMEAARTSETLVNFYQTTRRYNPQDSQLRTHRRENLKSYHYKVGLLGLAKRLPAENLSKCCKGNIEYIRVCTALCLALFGAGVTIDWVVERLWSVTLCSRLSRSHGTNAGNVKGDRWKTCGFRLIFSSMIFPSGLKKSANFLNIEI